MNDCITFVSKNNHEHTILLFNNHHEKIEFTIEMEKEGKINYLD